MLYVTGDIFPHVPDITPDFKRLHAPVIFKRVLLFSVRSATLRGGFADASFHHAFSHWYTMYCQDNSPRDTIPFRIGVYLKFPLANALYNSREICIRPLLIVSESHRRMHISRLYYRAFDTETLNELHRIVYCISWLHVLNIVTTSSFEEEGKAGFME